MIMKKLNMEKYLAFGRLMSIEEQNKFVKKVKNLDLAVKINPDIIVEGLDMLFEEYPKFKECFEDD